VHHCDCLDRAERHVVGGDGRYADRESDERSQDQQEQLSSRQLSHGGAILSTATAEIKAGFAFVMRQLEAKAETG
jgi:hypothetical protein